MFSTNGREINCAKCCTLHHNRRGEARYAIVGIKFRVWTILVTHKNKFNFVPPFYMSINVPRSIINNNVVKKTLLYHFWYNNLDIWQFSSIFAHEGFSLYTYSSMIYNLINNVVLHDIVRISAIFRSVFFSSSFSCLQFRIYFFRIVNISRRV